MKYVAMTVALLGAAGLYVGAKVLQQDPAGQASGWELRVFVLDKTTHKAIDLTDWSATLELTPKGGKEQKVFMAKSDVVKDLAPRRDEKFPDRDGDKPADPGVKPEEKTFDLPKADMAPKYVCGQVKDMDRYYVELVVVNTGWMKEKGLHKTGDVFPGDKPKEPAKDLKEGAKDLKEGAKETYRDAKDAVKDAAHGNGFQQKGYLHDHGLPYFKATLPRGWWSDAKHGSLTFDADVHFVYGTDKKSAKGFSYPSGLYKDILQKAMDEDLKQARDHVRANDAAKWKEVAERILCKTQALPELTFKKNEDREEFERAKRECMAACQRLCNATTKEQASEAIDQCKDKCDEYQDQSQDAEGVNWDFKGYDFKTPETKPLDKPLDNRK